MASISPLVYCVTQMDHVLVAEVEENANATLLQVSPSLSTTTETEKNTLKYDKCLLQVLLGTGPGVKKSVFLQENSVLGRKKLKVKTSIVRSPGFSGSAKTKL